MSDLPVEHYLKIYEARVSSAERGVSHPKPDALAGIRRLVAALRHLKPEEKVSLTGSSHSQWTFRNASSGELIAQIDFDDETAFF